MVFVVVVVIVVVLLWWRGRMVVVGVVCGCCWKWFVVAVVGSLQMKVQNCFKIPYSSKHTKAFDIHSSQSIK